MPRKKREWYPYAEYHVTARGNHQNDIFRDETDYELYLNCIKEAFEYYENKFVLICYCLMTNHVHLQIKTKDMPLSDLIKRINSLYAQSFNIKYNYVGHLFQGRYGAEIIKTDRYRLEASRYIHLNPMRAKIVMKPEEYKWSSYSMYIGIDVEKFINTEYIFSYFNKENKGMQYKQFVEEKGEGSDPWELKEINSVAYRT
jgi:putative transposase